MSLFEDFGPVSSKQWKQQMQFELKGADYNDTLVWNSAEDIKVKPFYHRDDFEQIPAAAPTQPFSICQDIFVHDVDKSIYRANDSIARGADSIRFTIDNPDIDIAKLLQALPLGQVTIYINTTFLSPDFLTVVDKIARDTSANIFSCCDPIGFLAEDGNWLKTTSGDNFEILKQATAASGATAISINGGLYQNAGANIIQQIAYSLGHANEYLNRIGATEKPYLFQLSVGTNYFFEIAKLRAIRLLFDLIAKEYGHTAGCHILAMPTKRNKTLYDYNVNMLRTTTECMSAIIGGADAVSNLPYDALYHKSNEFGERISRNQLLIMKHESYLAQVGNPADGSYYIESLTAQIAEKALVLFKEIEANDGFLKQLGAGTIQRKIIESADKEQQLFDDGKEVLLGTNKFPNKNDRMAHDLELYPFVKVKPRKTLLTPIIPRRLAEKSEQQRIQDEQQ